LFEILKGVGEGAKAKINVNSKLDLMELESDRENYSRKFDKREKWKREK